MWNDIPTTKEVYDYYAGKGRLGKRGRKSSNNPLEQLSTKERAHVRAEIEGVSVSRLGFKRDPEILNRPHVQNSIERILDESGLTDKKLSKRLSQIIFKGKGANADNTSHNAIRTAFQLKGKFGAEKHEVMHKGDLAHLSSTQLERIIEQGAKDLLITKVKLDASGN